MTESTHPAFSTLPRLPRLPQTLYEYRVLYGSGWSVQKQLGEIAGETWEFVDMKANDDTLFLLMRREMQ